MARHQQAAAAAPNSGERGPDPVVNELVVAFLKHAEGYYVRDGRPTGETVNLREALAPLSELYGDTPVREFGPASLRAVRQAMIDGDRSAVAPSIRGSIGSAAPFAGPLLKRWRHRQFSRGSAA